MELSLDDIIRKQRQKPQIRVRKGGGVVQLPLKKNNQRMRVAPKTVPKVKDARNRIILKKRTQITDARDKLAEMAKQKDARVKLEQLRLNRSGNVQQNRSPFGNAIIKNRNGNLSLRTKGRINRGIFTDSTRQVHPSPLVLSPRFSHNPQMNSALSTYPLDVSMEEEYVPLKPIIRSINNEMAHYLPPPPIISSLLRFQNQQTMPEKPLISDIRSGLNFKIVAKNNDVRVSPATSAGILRRNHKGSEGIFMRETSPTSPVSILKKRPVGSKVMSGLRSKYDPTPISLSNRLSSRHQPQISRSPSPPQPTGFRIVVSNLQSSVTGSDIHELFGDIGKLVESRLVRPGTAEVIYSSLRDAQKAVDVYHNRQLDGQPMKCFLVNPRNPPSNPTQDFSKSARGNKPVLPASSNSSVVPDISTFHKVLFRKH